MKDDRASAAASENEELRREAMERLRAGVAERGHDFARDLHEVEVYQEELLMQQESLVEANRRLETALAQSQMLFDEAPVAYFVIDGKGRIRSANLMAGECLGVERKRLGQRFLGSFLEPTSGVTFLSHLREALEFGQTRCCEVTLRTNTAAGPRRWELRLQPAASLSTERPECLLSAMDVTELREIERELVAAQREAERSAHLKGRFLANMSHEVRTPLSLILGYVDTILGEDAPPEILRRLKIVRRAGHNLLGVLNDVVDFSKIEANRLQINTAPFDPGDHLEHVRSLFRLAAEDRGIDLRYRETPDAPLPALLEADAARIGQVLVNLVSNAMKYTPDGGRIEITSAYRSGNLLITVEDTGPGIPPAELEYIFEPFRQADRSDSRQKPGAGLGLAISRQVLHLMRGDLVARNLKSGGAGFTVRLPAKIADPPRATKAPRLATPARVPASTRRLLLVEDDEDMRDLVSMFLTSLGYEHDIAENGQQALERLHEGEYGLVLMDLQMPVMDGMEAIAKIRAEPSTRDQPVVALSARALSQQMSESVAAGFNAHLTKPIDVEQLSATLAAHLG